MKSDNEASNGNGAKIGFLWKIIGRYDSYYAALNVRTAFLISVNSFAVVSMALQHSEMAQLASTELGQRIVGYCAAGIGFLALVSLAILLISSVPFMPQGKISPSKRSLIYFVEVAQFSPEEYARHLQESSVQRRCDDLCEQACSLAKGLNRKYKLTSLSGGLVVGQVLVAIIGLLSIGIG